MSLYLLFLLLSFCMLPILLISSTNGLCDELSHPKYQTMCKNQLNLIPLLSVPLFGVILLVVLRTVFAFNDVNIENAEERAKKLQGKGMEHFLKKTKAELIDRSKRGNELYEIKMFRTYRLKWLKYEDPSTVGKIYGCFVPSEMTKADEAMAWKFQITEEEYDGLEIEA